MVLRICYFRSNSADSSFIGDLPAPGGNTLNTSAAAKPPPPVKGENLHRKVELGATEELSIGGELRQDLFFFVFFSTSPHSFFISSEKVENYFYSSVNCNCIKMYLSFS